MRPKENAMNLQSLEALAAEVPDGASLALPPDKSLPSVALAKALIRRGVRNLNLIGVPVSGFATDILIGAGCVASVQTSAVSLGEAGFAPRFSAALRAAALMPISDDGAARIAAGVVAETFWNALRAAWPVAPGA
jgi:glutaconate CoA-transferase subunit A